MKSPHVMAGLADDELEVSKSSLPLLTSAVQAESASPGARPRACLELGWTRTFAMGVDTNEVEATAASVAGPSMRTAARRSALGCRLVSVARSWWWH